MAQNLTSCRLNVRRQKNVSSGKVYRQIFDAEVQLVASLLTYKSNKTPLENSAFVPNIRSGLQISHNLENYFEKEREDVVMLPEIVPQKKESSNIMEKNNDFKSKRHQITIDNLMQNIYSLGKEMEKESIEVSDAFLVHLSESHKFVGHLMSSLNCTEALEAMTLHQLNLVWRNVEEETSKRKKLILTFEEEFKAMEERRHDEMMCSFERARQELLQIGFKTQLELDKFFSHQSQILNKTMLSNKRTYTRLVANIKLNEVEFHQDNLTTWKEKICMWKKIHQETLIDRFRRYMEGEQMKDPKKTYVHLQDTIREQASLNKTRVERIMRVKELSLFSISKQKVMDLEEAVLGISKEIVSVYNNNLNLIRSSFEEVRCAALLNYQNLKSELITNGMYEEPEADVILEDSCHGLLVSQKEFFEQAVAGLEVNLT